MRWFFWGIAWVCVALSIWVSLLDPEHLRLFVLSQSTDGKIEWLTPAFIQKLHRSLVGVLALSAVVLGGIGVTWHRWMRWAMTVCEDWKTTFVPDVRDIFLKTLRDFGRLSKSAQMFFLIAGIVGIGLRIYWIFQPNTCDEASTVVHFVDKSILVTLSYTRYFSNHWLLSLLAKIPFFIFGYQIWAIRLVSFAFFLLWMGMALPVMMRLFGKEAGILALVLSLLSPDLAQYSVFARGYMIQIFLFFTILFLVLFVRGSSSVRRIGVVLASALVLRHLPTSALIFPSIGMIVAGSKDRWILPSLITVCWTLVLTLGFYLPVFATQGLQPFVANPFTPPLPWRDFVQTIPSFFDQWRVFFWGIHPGLAYGAVPLIGLAVWSALIQKKQNTSGLWVFALLLLSMLGAAALQRRFMVPRAYLLGLPLGLGVLSYGVFSLSGTQKYLTWILAGTLTLVVAHGVQNPRTPFTPDLLDLRGVVTYLETSLGPEDRIYTVSPLIEVLEYDFVKDGFPVKHIFDAPGPQGRQFVLSHSAIAPHQEIIRGYFSNPKFIYIWNGFEVWEVFPLASNSTKD